MDNIIFDGGAYKITHNESGSFYFGCTNNFITRQRDHKYHLAKGSHSNETLQNLFNKDNNISIEHYPTTDRDEASALEELLIAEHKDNPQMVNKVFAGYTPPMANKEWVEKMRFKNTGRDVSNETRLKMSAASKLRGISEQCRQKNIEAKNKSVIVKGVTYKSITEAAIALNVNKTSVCRWVRNPEEKYNDCIYAE